MLKIFVCLILFLVGFAAAGQHIADDKLRSAMQKAVDLKIKNLGVNTCNYDNSKAFKWNGTSSSTSDLQSTIDAQFAVNFNGGELAKEVAITVDFFFGGQQNQFDSQVLTYLKNNPKTETQSLTEYANSFANTMFLRNYSKKTDVSYWNCERKIEASVLNNGGKNFGRAGSCGRASQNNTLVFPLCDGYYGIYLVTVKVLRLKKKNTSRCNGNSSYNIEEYCFPFYVSPVVPPAIRSGIVDAAFVYPCSNSEITSLKINYNGPSNGICWVVGDKNFTDRCSPNPNIAFQALSDVTQSYKGRYVLESKECPNLQIQGSIYPFKTISVQDRLELGAPESTTTIIDKFCDTIVVPEEILKPRDFPMNRELLWYQSKLDFSEEAFHVGDTLKVNGSIPCFDGSQIFYIATRETDPDGACDPVESQRSKFAILPYFLFKQSLEEILPITEDISLLDSRFFLNLIDCESESAYHTVLDEPTAGDILSKINSVLNDTRFREDSLNAHLDSMFFDWYRVDSLGDDISIQQDSSIYKVVNMQKIVCAENTGIDMNDFDSTATYRARLHVELSFTNKEGEPYPAPMRPLDLFFEKNISLAPLTVKNCAKQFKDLKKRTEKLNQKSDCNSLELVSICPKNANDVLVGVSPERLGEYFNQTNGLQLTNEGYMHSWFPKEGILNPGKTKSAFNYDQMLSEAGHLSKNVLLLRLNESAVTANKIEKKHCVYAYHCPTCITDITLNEVQQHSEK